MIRALAPIVGVLSIVAAPSLRGVEPVGQTPGAWPLRLLDARHDAMRFVGWQENGRLSFLALAESPGGQKLRVDARDVVRFGRGAAARGGQGLLLVDGSLLVGRVERITETECVVKGRYFDASIPRPLVRAVLFAAPSLAGLQTQIIRDAFSSTGGDDVAIAVDGDRTAGTLRPASAGDAVVWERGIETLAIAQRERDVTLPVARLRALIFSPLLTPRFGSDRDSMTVGFVDGSRLQVQRTQASAVGPIRWELACGVEVAASGRRWSPAAVSYLSARRVGDEGAARRLSDERPLRLRLQPLFAAARDLSPDAGISSAPSGVWVDGRWYGNAIAMPSAARAVYRGVAAGGFFRADVAIRDADVPDAALGSAEFRVLVADPRGQLREVWRSAAVRGGEGLVAVEVPLPATAAVVLAVDPGERGAAGDRAVWIDPVVVSR